MKKRFLTLMLLLTVGLSTTFAKTDEGVNEKVINSFKKEFVDARDVRFENGKEFVKATFTMNEQVMFAYFSENGELIAVTRNIRSNQLPLNLLSDLKKNYGDSWITDLFEIAAQSETSYYLTVENPDNVIVLKSTGSNGWEVYKKVKKNKE